MSSGVSSDAGGESKTAAKGDEGRAGYIVHPGGDAVPKKVDTVVAWLRVATKLTVHKSTVYLWK